MGRARWDVWTIAAALVAVNLPLLGGGTTELFALIPGEVARGQWWRIFLHPFAHISWYHLILDAVPFFLLYPLLDEPVALRRLLYVVCAGAGSAAAAWGLPLVQVDGVRGLSGITYGVMAVGALEMTCGPGRVAVQRVVGSAVLAFLVGMVALEQATGRFPFESLLFGMVGQPVLVCHAGGIIGALVARLILSGGAALRRGCGAV